MTLSKNRIKQILRNKKKKQSKKILKKSKHKKIHKKNLNKNTFRHKKKNLRTNTIKIKKRKRIAKNKRKAYIFTGGAKNSEYTEKFTYIIKEYLTTNKDKTDGEDIEEDKYYNFDFLITKDDDDTQEILDMKKLQEEFNELAKTEIEKDREAELKKEQDESEIHKETQEFIEDGKKINRSMVYVVNPEGSQNPAVFIESEDSNNENATTGIDSWFEKIFDSM